MTAKNSQELKQLQTRRDRLKVQVDSLKEESKQKNKELSKAQNQLKSVLDQIEQLKEADIVVTEHAILRFIERSMGIDLEQVTNLILTEKLKHSISALGNGRHPIGDGMKAVVKDNAIVSIV
jgi:chromosome segregation ATPase